MAWAYRIFHDGGKHLHGQEVGPVSLVTSRVDQRHYILLGVGKRHVDIEAGSAWGWAQRSCAGSQGVGGD